MKTWKNVLFDSFEDVHFQDTPNSNANSKNEAHQYFCINPLNGSRADANVSRFGNILLEFDQGELYEQYNLFNRAKLPYSLLTWSGNKSLHVIIALTASLTKEEYKKVTKALYKKFPTADKSCSNPSRLSRTPLAVNTKTKQKQELYEIHDRVDTNYFLNWVGPLEPDMPEQTLKTEPAEGYVPLLNIFTKHYLAFGSEPGRRNSDLFKAACDMFKCGWNESEIFSAVAAVADLEMHEIKTTIKSAKRTALK